MHPFKILLAIIVLLAILAGGYLGFVMLRQQAQLASGEQFSVAVASTLLDTYSVEYFTSVSAAQANANLDTRGKEIKLNNLRRLGELQSMGEVTGELVNPSWLPTDEPLVARYYIATEFILGEAEIYTELVEENGAWKLLNFYIQSPLLVE